MKQAAVLKVCSRPTVPCFSTVQQERMVFEDDLIAAFNTQTTSDDASSAAALNSGINLIQPGSSSSTTAGEIAPPSPSSSTKEGDRAPPAPSTPSHMDQLQSQKKPARDSLVQQAERMVRRNRVQHSPGNPGDNVTVPIFMVDRGRGDPRNLMGVIIDRDDNDMYRIAVRTQVLNGKYSRNQFGLCIHKLLQITDVSTDEKVALRIAVQRQSLCGGQGFVKCNCAGSGGCKSNRCKCFKGPSIYDVHQKITFLTPPPPLSTCVHMGRTSPPCGCPHTADIKYTPLS